MELRYVYRRVEDDIGSSLNIEESLHSYITRQLRYAIREGKDLARHTALNALCLAALSGNNKIDVMSMSSKIVDMVDQSLYQEVPYIGVEERSRPKEQSKSDYELAFEELERFTKELNEGKAQGFNQAK